MLYIDFTPTPVTLNLREQLPRIQEALAPWAALDDGQAFQLRRHALAQSIHFSTRMEGNTLSLRQVEAIVGGEHVTAPAEQVQEVRNYQEALEYVRGLAADRAVITEETIRQIHYLVSKGLSGYNPGRYRIRQNYVRNSVTDTPVFVPPEPGSVPLLMGELVEFINRRTGLDPFYRAGLAHLNFVAIHPFEDGNGRTARVLETLLLHQEQFAGQALVSLEAYFGGDNLGYYRALSAALGPSFLPPRDVSSWLEYYLAAHHNQEREALARYFIAFRVGFELSLFYPTLNELKVAALVVARHNGSVTNRDYRALTGQSAQTAAKALKGMVEAGVFERRGSGRGVHYTVTEATAEVMRRGAEAGEAEFMEWLSTEQS